MIVKLDRLKIPKIHEEIYCTSNIKDLKHSISESGLLEKIVINKNFEIVSGVLRFKALRELGYSEVEVSVRDTELENEPVLRIAYNKQRIKTASELLNEVEQLKSLYAEKPGRKAGIVKPGEKTDTRAKIGEILGISTGNISKLQYIKENKPEILEEIDKGNLTINQAHLAIKTHQRNKKSININANLPKVISKKYYTIYNKSSDDLSDIANESVQLIFTSPPYWRHRKFTDDSNELGSERTSEEFVQRLANHLDACHRVLKTEGSFFLNLGDTYFNKCLQLIPHRVILELVKRGWILRNDIVWKKTNPLCLRTTDKLTTSYEHIFHLTKSKIYTYNETLIPLSSSKSQIVNNIIRKQRKQIFIPSVSVSGLRNEKKMEDFWTDDIIYTACANQAAIKKYGGISHPAPFPPEICLLPILQTTKPNDTVLDIFSGTSSVGLQAILQGRSYIGYELNPVYHELQEKRLDDAIAQYNQTSNKIAA